MGHNRKTNPTQRRLAQEADLCVQILAHGSFFTPCLEDRGKGNTTERPGADSSPLYARPLFSVLLRRVGKKGGNEGMAG